MATDCVSGCGEAGGEVGSAAGGKVGVDVGSEAGGGFVGEVRGEVGGKDGKEAEFSSVFTHMRFQVTRMTRCIITILTATHFILMLTRMNFKLPRMGGCIIYNHNVDTEAVRRYVDGNVFSGYLDGRRCSHKIYSSKLHLYAYEYGSSILRKKQIHIRKMYIGTFYQCVYANEISCYM